MSKPSKIGFGGALGLLGGAFWFNGFALFDDITFTDAWRHMDGSGVRTHVSTSASLRKCSGVYGEGESSSGGGGGGGQSIFATATMKFDRVNLKIDFVSFRIRTTTRVRVCICTYARVETMQS